MAVLVAVISQFSVAKRGALPYCQKVSYRHTIVAVNDSACAGTATSGKWQCCGSCGSKCQVLRIIPYRPGDSPGKSRRLKSRCVAKAGSVREGRHRFSLPRGRGVGTVPDEKRFLLDSGGGSVVGGWLILDERWLARLGRGARKSSGFLRFLHVDRLGKSLHLQDALAFFQVAPSPGRGRDAGRKARSRLFVTRLFNIRGQLIGDVGEITLHAFGLRERSGLSWSTFWREGIASGERHFGSKMRPASWFV